MLNIETGGALRILTIERPERRNALGTMLMETIDRALADAERDPDIGAIILTGTPPAFCAGSDLKELGGLSIADMRDHEAKTAEVVRSIGTRSKPVVAAVEGYALGGGFILAVSCDVVVTGTDTRWHLPEVKNGWLPPWGLHALMSRVGPVRAKQLTWAPAPVDGREAYRLGVADLVAPAGHVLQAAIEYASALATLSKASVESTKRFYAPFIVRDAERADVEASAAFGRDCESETARTTFARFKVPA